MHPKRDKFSFKIKIPRQEIIYVMLFIYRPRLIMMRNLLLKTCSLYICFFLILKHKNHKQDFIHIFYMHEFYVFCFFPVILLEGYRMISTYELSVFNKFCFTFLLNLLFLIWYFDWISHSLKVYESIIEILGKNQ